MLDEEEEEEDLSFKRGDKYILADLGGGTADIAVHEVLSAQSVREIARPCGGAQGSSYIDDAFVSLLERALGKRWMSEFKLTEPNHFVALLCNFRSAKRSFWAKRGVDTTLTLRADRFHNVELPYDFVRFMDDKLEDLAARKDADVDDDDDNAVDEMEDGGRLEALFGAFSCDAPALQVSTNSDFDESYILFSES